MNFISRAAAIAVVATSLSSSDPALGQAFPGLPAGFGEALQPDFAARDLKLFVEDLQLDEGQKAVMESLFADYETAFKGGADKVRASVGALDPTGEIEDGSRNERMALIRRELESLVDKANEEEAEESPEERAARVATIKTRIEQLRVQLKELNPDPPRGDELHKTYQRIAEALQNWRSEKALLRDQFITNVQAVLKDEQKERWPALVRRLTRERTLNKGRLSGESIDLIRLVKEMKFTPQVSETIQPALVEYDVKLDAALLARNDVVEKSQQPLLQASQNRDTVTITSITDNVMKSRAAVRNVNDDYAALIATKLPPEPAADFIRTVQLRAYPRVYRPTQTQRLFDAARELEGLDAQVMTSIKEVELAYVAELGPANDRLREVIRANEAADQVNRATLKTGPRTDGPSNDDPIGQAFQQRNQMGQTYADRLKSLLTEEQWAQLPTGRLAPEPSSRQ